MDSSTFPSPPKKLPLFLSTSFLFLLLSLYLTTNVLNQSQLLGPPSMLSLTQSRLSHELNTNNHCSGLHDDHQYKDYRSKCVYVKSRKACRSKGYINYFEIFYCNFGQFPQLGYATLLLWLVLLFYMLGNTASDYFCPSLEGLSKVLNLSPTIAGTTLLPLGSGATDVFSSIISFTQPGESGVGVNSVLGGAFFISSVVVGIISLLIASREISVDKNSFIRDVLFSLLTLSSLFFIVLVGKINLWGAIGFVSIYFVYILVVSAMHFLFRKKDRVVNLSSSSDYPTSRRSSLDEYGHEMDIPLLGCVDEEKSMILVGKGDDDQKGGGGVRFLSLDPSIHVYLAWFLYVLELPLYLPRRLTIPMVREERWSKPFAVISVTLAPILVSTLWNTTQREEEMGSKTSLVIYMGSGLVGLVLGTVALLMTKMSNPPRRCLFPWLGGGFFMSVTWTYIFAGELVSLLVSLGSILGISPSILGFTVLAWGNSTGDVIANVAVAMNGGSDGAQIAISGCYAGPLFNILVGLGFSFVYASWSQYPSPCVIPTDPFLCEMLGFLMAGLLWALVVLPRKKMCLDRSLGVGLLAIYSCFLFLRLARALGLYS